MSLTVLVNAGPWLPVPPPAYGGIESVVATLVPELRAAGVRVVLATVGTSTLEVDERLVTLPEGRFAEIARPYNQVSGVAHAHMHAVVSALQDGLEVDLVHDHLEVVGPAALAALGRGAPPALQTLHWDLGKHADFYESFDGRGRVGFAAVSDSQLERAPARLRRQAVGVVPLASPLPTETFTERGDHVLVLARITPDKGQDTALRVCRDAGLPVVLAGPVAGVGDPEELRTRLRHEDPELLQHPDTRYFVECVAPLLDGVGATWVGSVGGSEKERLLQTARALLTPVRWAEPGATAVVEAMVRGVPVVGTPLGVLPSLVRHGVTGFLAGTEDGLARCLGRVGDLDPQACRDAAAPWTPGAMAQQYVDLYHRVLGGGER